MNKKSRINYKIACRELSGSKFMFIMVIFMFFVFPLGVSAQSCNCDSCTSCSNQLNDASCTEVYLTTNIMDFTETCINNPVNFSNKTFDCQWHIIDGSGVGYGIYLDNKQNNTIKNCIITGFVYGIYLSSSSNNTIANNINSNNNRGIYLYSSSNNILINNTANSNVNDHGIYLYNSPNNILINNTANSNSQRGIYLQSSSNNTLINTIVNLNGQEGIYLSFSNNNILINNIANSNRYGIYLYSSSNNTLINNVAINSTTKDGIDLYNSSNNILANNTVSLNNQSGIILYYSSNNILANNTVNSNGNNGIALGSSNNNTLVNNNVSGNDYRGISLYDSSNNTLANNIVNSNSYGIYLELSSNNTLTNNFVILSIQYGIYLYNSSGDNKIYNNFFNNTNNFGLGGTVYPNNWNTTRTVKINIIGGPYLGGNFWAKPDGTGFSETCSDNNKDGICDSSYTLDSNNIDYLPLTFAPSLSRFCSCISCNDCVEKLNHPLCIEVKLTADIIDHSGNCIYNPENFSSKIFDCQGYKIDGTGTSNTYGIYLNNKQNSTIKNCVITDFQYGIFLFESSNNILANNNASSNMDGIYLLSSSNNTLINNTANSNSGGGIILDYSSNNTLINNTANSNSGGDGIILANSSNNNIINNSVNLNDYGVSLLYSSNNNTLVNNFISSNNIYGIYLEDSSNNKIYNNFFNNTNNFGFNEANVNDWNTTRTVKINIIGGPYLGGNFWAKPDGTGFSETCSDNNKDGICDSSYTLDSNNIDYLPLTFYFNRAPQITLNEPINNSQFNTQDINFKFIVIDDLNTTLTCSIYLDGTLKQTNSSVQNNTLTNFLITGISYGSHSWYINCSDGELINVSEVRYFTIATSSGGGGGAGGGGVIGGGGSSSGTGDVSSGSTSNQFDIFPGKPKIVQINSDIVKAITILVESDNRNASLNFSIKKCPAIDTRRLIYACFEVSHNITNITQANISFCVNNSWIVQHDVRTIILARLTNNWDSLLTIRRVASDNQTCFEAISPGLSWFAILGLDIPQICQPLTRRCAESKIQQCNIEGTNWYDIEVCDYGCDPLTLTCKPKPLSQSSECQAGQKRCFDNWVQICSDGQWQSQQFCQFGCVDGFCLKKTNSTIVWIIVGIIVSVVIVMFSLKKTVLR